MMERPALLLKLTEAPALQAWFGEPARSIPDAEVLRWWACYRTAQRMRQPRHG